MDTTSSSGVLKGRAARPVVIIFGSGACAHQIAANLNGHGLDAQLVTGCLLPSDRPASEHARLPLALELTRCRGFAGEFELLLQNDTEAHVLTASAIVVAEDAEHIPNYALYGLQAGNRVTDITALEKLLQLPASQQSLAAPGRIAFFNGWASESQPSVAKRMLDACCQLQQRSGIHTWFLTGNLKVAADGAEARVQQARQAGTVFIKSNASHPAIESVTDDHFAITCMDEVVREPVGLHADWIVVDETITPTRRLSEVAQRLGIHVDNHGFAQADNVRRLSNATNRRGIFVAGGARGILSARHQQADADQVTLQVLHGLQMAETATTGTQVAVQQGRCARCLTCYRLCPHLAIDIETRITVVPQACQQCGICVAGCPARAIEMQDNQLNDEVHSDMRFPAIQPQGSAPSGRIVVFGCVRSAGQARDLIRLAGQQLPPEVHYIDVPCGGSLADRHLLAAFESGADGVLVCTCHTDNCQSEIGDQVARKRVNAVQALLASAGLDERRLRIVSVAANMGTELAGMIGSFVDELAALDER